MEGIKWIWDKFFGVINTSVEVAIILVLIGLFVWFVIGTRREPELWETIKDWLFASIGAIIAILVCLLLSPEVLPESDSWALYRHLILRLSTFSLGLMLLVGSLLFVDRVLKPDLIGSIVKAEYGPTIFLSTLTLALSLLLCYT